MQLSQLMDLQDYGSFPVNMGYQRSVKGPRKREHPPIALIDRRRVSGKVKSPAVEQLATRGTIII